MYLQIDARLCLYSFRLKDYEYEQLADETLDSLTEVFEDLPDRLGSCGTEYDVTFGVSSVNPIALRKAKTLWSFGLSECKRVKVLRAYLHLHVISHLYKGELL